MNLESRHETRYLLLLSLGVFAASTAIGAAVGASRLGLFVPAASSGSLRDAATIFTNNMQIVGLLAVVTAFQPRGIPSLTPGFLPRWLADLTVVLIVCLNLIAIGGALGALGFRALFRMAPHAPLEIGGYVVMLAAFLRARRGQLGRREAVQRLTLACALLLCGALVESYVSGGLG
jgi:hypothetical protein